MTLSISLPASAQVYRRQAAMMGSNVPGQGRCVVQVLVDGAAEVTVQGTSGSVRDLSGRPARWQRFECTGAMPSNPASFHFRALNGRGHQQLVRDPRNGGVAAVRIEDKEAGPASYTFELDWSNGGPNYPGYEPNNRGYYPRNENGPNGQSGPYGYGSANRGYGSANREREMSRVASESCRRAVDYRMRSEGYGDVRFEWMHQNRWNDRVEGMVTGDRGYGAESLRFGCRIDPNDGDVWSVELGRR